MSTNLYRQLREAVETKLATVTGVRKVQGLYNGEDWPALSAIVARDGASAWTRVSRATAREGASAVVDCADVFVHILIAANATAERPLAAANAEQIGWDAYAAVKRSSLGLTWLRSGLFFSGMEIEFQSTNCTIVSLLMRGHADLAMWSA